MTSKIEARGEVSGEVELPEWAEVEQLVAEVIEGYCTGDGEVEARVPTDLEGRQLLASALRAAINPVFDRLLAAVAAARAGQAAAEARDASWRALAAGLDIAARHRSACDLSGTEVEFRCSGCIAARRAEERAHKTLAAPAPEPGGLLALVRELEAERQEAIKANHEPLSRGEDFHRKATARYIAVDCFLGRLRAAIGLPPAETGGTA